MSSLFKKFCCCTYVLVPQIIRVNSHAQWHQTYSIISPSIKLPITNISRPCSLHTLNILRSSGNNRYLDIEVTSADNKPNDHWSQIIFANEWLMKSTCFLCVRIQNENTWSEGTSSLRAQIAWNVSLPTSDHSENMNLSVLRMDKSSRMKMMFSSGCIRDGEFDKGAAGVYEKATEPR